LKRIRELIRLGNENRNLDYKGVLSWEQVGNDEKCEITKNVLAFANARRPGGVIVTGVDNKSSVPEGLSDEQSAWFDQTEFNSFVQKYSDPRTPRTFVASSWTNGA
jgi:predicted HTH transcriptional regulator